MKGIAPRSYANDVANAATLSHADDFRNLTCGAAERVERARRGADGANAETVMAQARARITEANFIVRGAVLRTMWLRYGYMYLSYSISIE